MDTTYTPINLNQAAREFGSAYPALLTNLHTILTRERATAYLTTRQVVQVPLGEKTANFTVESSKTYPEDETDYVEFRLRYLGVEGKPLPPPPDTNALLQQAVTQQLATFEQRSDGKPLT